MVITSQGKTLKIAADSVSTQGKGAKGVRILNIDRPDFVIGLDKVAKEEEAEALANEEAKAVSTETVVEQTIEEDESTGLTEKPAEPEETQE
jgi:DNA gyrase subunit A